MSTDTRGKNFKLTTKNTSTTDKAYEEGKFKNIHKYQKAAKLKAKGKK